MHESEATCMKLGTPPAFCGEPGCSAGAVRGCVGHVRDSAAVLSSRVISLGSCGRLRAVLGPTWANGRLVLSLGSAAFTVIPRCSARSGALVVRAVFAQSRRYRF